MTILFMQPKAESHSQSVKGGNKNIYFLNMTRTSFIPSQLTKLMAFSGAIISRFVLEEITACRQKLIPFPRQAPEKFLQ